MVTRAEAVETLESTKPTFKKDGLRNREVREALEAAEQLAPSERQHVVTELATALWLRSLVENGPLYSGFEAFLHAHFSTMKDFERNILSLMSHGLIGAEARALYYDYLRGMFQSSGKMRSQFYAELLTDMAIPVCLESVEFGAKAEHFYRSVVDTLHGEHLLVFYSVGLLLKVFKKRHPNSRTPLTEEEVEAMYQYFEKSLPLSERFMEYAIDESLLDYNFGGERLFQIS